MPTWTFRLAVWHLPQPGAAWGTVTSQTIRVNVECCCCEQEVGGNREPPEIQLTQPLAAIHQVSIEKESDEHQFGERANPLPPRVRIRGSRCSEGPGIIVWIECVGQFDHSPSSPPYDWAEWGARGAWRICCCCDPISGKTDWSATTYRTLKGSVEKDWLYLVIQADEKPACDDEVQIKRTTIRYRP